MALPLNDIVLTGGVSVPRRMRFLSLQLNFSQDNVIEVYVETIKQTGQISGDKFVKTESGGSIVMTDAEIRAISGFNVFFGALRTELFNRWKSSNPGEAP